MPTSDRLDLCDNCQLLSAASGSDFCIPTASVSNMHVQTHCRQLLVTSVPMYLFSNTQVQTHYKQLDILCKKCCMFKWSVLLKWQLLCSNKVEPPAGTLHFWKKTCNFRRTCFLKLKGCFFWRLLFKWRYIFGSLKNAYLYRTTAFCLQNEMHSEVRSV